MPTTSKREAILAHLASYCDGHVGDGVSLVRERTRPVPKSTNLFVIYAPESDRRLDAGGYAHVDRELVINFQFYARGATPASLVDPGVIALHARLMSDRTLGGRCWDVVANDNDFDYDDADEDLCVVNQRYAIRYRSLETDLTS